MGDGGVSSHTAPRIRNSALTSHVMQTHVRFHGLLKKCRPLACEINNSTLRYALNPYKVLDQTRETCYAGFIRWNAPLLIKTSQRGATILEQISQLQQSNYKKWISPSS